LIEIKYHEKQAKLKEVQQFTSTRLNRIYYGFVTQTNIAVFNTKITNIP